MTTIKFQQCSLCEEAKNTPVNIEHKLSKPTQSYIKGGKKSKDVTQHFYLYTNNS